MNELMNFDLAIEVGGAGYRARVVASPAGEAEEDFALPFSEKDLEILVLKVVGSVGRTRRKVRRLDPVERRLLEDFGGQLFEAVFSGSVRNCLDRSLATADSRGSGLRIRLRLPGALTNIPWEYLYDRENGFVCLSPETPLVRYVAMGKPLRPFQVTPPLRILAMVSAPSDVPQLQNEDEWDMLRSSLSDLSLRGLVETERLPAGTLAALQRPLRLRDYHVLHFVGHGLYDENAQDGALALEDEDGQVRLVTGRDLGIMLRGHRSLRLVVLNACEGARGAVDDPLGGVAQALVRQGIPAVIAMQFEISDPAALVFSRSFYQALADGLPVDVAMVESRRAMFAAGNVVEWATPVLYLRAADARIFDLPTGDDRIRLQDDADYLEDDPLLEDQLADARHQRQLAAWDTMAEEAMQQARWQDAVLALERLSAARANDPEIERRLEEARAGRTRAEQAEILARQQSTVPEPPSVAEMPERLVARLIDGVIFLIVLLTLTPGDVSTDSGQLSDADALRLAAIFLAIAVYEVVLTAVWGSTLGKKLFRLKVVRSSDGSAAGWREALVRWFIQFLAWWPCVVVGALVLYASPLWDRSGRRQGWHDKLAGTIVVKLPPR